MAYGATEFICSTARIVSRCIASMLGTDGHAFTHVHLLLWYASQAEGTGRSAEELPQMLITVNPKSLSERDGVLVHEAERQALTTSSFASWTACCAPAQSSWA